LYGKIFFNRLERISGIHFGVADRFLIRKLVEESIPNRSLEAMKEMVLSHLILLGYDSVKLKSYYKFSKLDLIKLLD
jgi:hypothetical protein